VKVSGVTIRHAATKRDFETVRALCRRRACMDVLQMAAMPAP